MQISAIISDLAGTGQRWINSQRAQLCQQIVDLARQDHGEPVMWSYKHNADDTPGGGVNYIQPTSAIDIVRRNNLLAGLLLKNVDFYVLAF